jgi:hypothetical protein
MISHRVRVLTFVVLDVVPAVLWVRDLAANNTTLGADDPFRVQSGYIHSNGVTSRRANVSAAAGDLTATLSSDVVSIGQLITAGNSGGSVAVQIPVGQNLSPNTVATGGVALDPTGPGTVNVSASAAGYTTYAGSTFSVTITARSMSMADVWWGDHRIGGGLQAPYRVTLGASAHGGVTVRIASSDASVGEVKTLVEISPSATVEVSANQFDSPSTVASGGIAFDPIVAGATSISTEVIGFDNTWSGAVEIVTVNP